MMESKTILAVIVLYRVPADASQAFCSLRSLMSSDPQIAAAIDAMICDNSPEEQPRPEGFSGLYLWDRTNPGLANAYNLTLGVALERGIPWLLLLDQDTSLTPEYLGEIIPASSHCRDQPEIVALAPRLAENGVICSPAYPPRLGPARAVPTCMSGVTSETLHAFNSGAVLRVSALQAMGGFPRDFPLDYLDHATFAQLQRRGGRLYLLDSVLEHQLSSNQEGRTDDAFTRRQAQVLAAERMFYNRFGTAGDRIRRRLRLLRACLGRVVRGKERGQTWRMLKSAIKP
jgi:GT2 family glycosyltransferase